MRAFLALLFAAVCSHGFAAEAVAWRVVHGDVRVVCPMTVGGSFEARTGAISGTLTPAAAAGAFTGDLSVELSTLDTGIGLRNEHLRNGYLEVGRGQGFERAVLSEIRLPDVEPQGFEGKTRFTGTFAVHGIKRAIEGQAIIHHEGRAVRVEARFPVTVSQFGIAKPQYLGVGVRDQVDVLVTLLAEPSPGPGVSR
jgi:hypothetical protein